MKKQTMKSLFASMLTMLCAPAFAGMPVARGGNRVVVAGPYKYGCRHDAVIVVALNGTHLLAVLLELVEVKLVCCL